MPRSMPATQWKRHAFIGDLCTGITFVAYMLAGAYVHRGWFGAGLVFFAVGFVRQRIRFRRMRCESCGEILHRKMEDGAAIRFHCSRCDIEWDTGVFQDSSH